MELVFSFPKWDKRVKGTKQRTQTLSTERIKGTRGSNLDSGLDLHVSLISRQLQNNETLTLFAEIP